MKNFNSIILSIIFMLVLSLNLNANKIRGEYATKKILKGRSII